MKMGNRYEQFKHVIGSLANSELENQRYEKLIGKRQQEDNRSQRTMQRAQEREELMAQQEKAWGIRAQYGAAAHAVARGVTGLFGLYGLAWRYDRAHWKFYAYLPQDDE